MQDRFAIGAFAVCLLLGACVRVPPPATQTGDPPPNADMPDASNGGTGGDTDPGDDNVRLPDGGRDVAGPDTRPPPIVVDEDDANDEAAAADPFELGNHIAGVTDESTSDWWIFNVPTAPTIVEIEKVVFELGDGSISTDRVAVRLTSVDSAISQRAFRTDESDVRRFFMSVPGDYYLEVEDDSDSVIYEFAVRERELPPIIPSDSLPMKGDLSDKWPDIYEFVPPSTGRVGVELAASSDRGDPFIIVQEADGEMIAFNDDDGDLKDSYVEVDVIKDQRIWVVATGWYMPDGATGYQLNAVPIP